MDEYIVYITCPLCGMNRVLEKKGSRALLEGKHVTAVKGRIRFDHVDLDNAYIVQYRKRPSGSPPGRRGGGSGFELQAGLTLKDMLMKIEFRDLANQIFEQSKKILAQF